PTSRLVPPMHTDLERLRRGGVGGQFWSIYLPHDIPQPVQAFQNQVRLARRIIDRYPQLELATTAADVRRIHGQGRIASLLGVEGGHALGGSLAPLEWLHEKGVRYLTLTHTSDNAIGDSANGTGRHGGLSEFGRQVVRRMNDLGIMVDLAHVSDRTMHDVLELSRSPVVFTHSNVRALCNSPRNVPNGVLERLRDNGGVVMVSFVPGFVSEEVRRERRDRATLAEVVDHIDFLRDRVGIEHIGIGADFDGISQGPIGLEDVSAYPALVDELLGRGYSEADIARILGGNVLRVLEENRRRASSSAGSFGGSGLSQLLKAGRFPRRSAGP
ncbi:MAG: membrane dipeptidase, partial [Armatimonadetes bacterium]|nr:membrane dipeptidase [Armatimonadota bacterium]